MGGSVCWERGEGELQLISMVLQDVDSDVEPACRGFARLSVTCLVAHRKSNSILWYACSNVSRISSRRAPVRLALRALKFHVERDGKPQGSGFIGVLFLCGLII